MISQIPKCGVKKMGHSIEKISEKEYRLYQTRHMSSNGACCVTLYLLKPSYTCIFLIAYCS
jgi:hypothetical protein